MPYAKHLEEAALPQPGAIAAAARDLVSRHVELSPRMPSLGADMEQGTVLEWLVEPGDTVHRGDVVALVDTEKAEIEAEIFERRHHRRAARRGRGPRSRSARRSPGSHRSVP